MMFSQQAGQKGNLLSEANFILHLTQKRSFAAGSFSSIVSTVVSGFFFFILHVLLASTVFFRIGAPNDKFRGHRLA